MTRDDINAQILERLNLSSATAIARINREIQERYNWVLDEVGLAPSTKGAATANTSNGVRTVSFTMQRLDQLFITTGLAALEQVSIDELLREATASAAPAGGDNYSILTVTGTAVTVMLQNTPTGTTGMTAYGLLALSNLGASDVPAFPAVFHDILVYGVLGIELRKMEKLELANANEEIFKMRLGQLSTYLTNTPS